MKTLCLLNKFEKRLWICSLFVVAISSAIGGVSPINLFTSLLGVSGLIFVAKGHVLGQIITIIFSILYGIVSLQFGYYGEMITYLGMTLPMALLAAIAWLKNPYEKGKQEVAIAPFYRADWIKLLMFTAIVTLAFYCILGYLSTPNLVLSTVSISTSFSASYLTYRRSPFYALAYALNDIVVIGLWSYASFLYLPNVTMVVCFLMFLLNDLYGFYNWRRMQRVQADGYCR